MNIRKIMTAKKDIMDMMKEIYRFKDIPDWKDDIIFIFLSGAFFLLALSSIAILMNTISVVVENKIPIRLGTIISIVIVVIGIGYFAIRKIVNKYH